MPDHFDESPEDRESQRLLVDFLMTTDLLIERLLDHLVRHAHSVAHRAQPQLDRIWRSARERLKGVVESIRIGLSRSRRELLRRVGMYGEALAAKWELLAFDIREGAVKRVVKRLNSMLSSLAKVFPALHAVKECKDHIEATVEGLKDAPEIITFGDLLK